MLFSIYLAFALLVLSFNGLLGLVRETQRCSLQPETGHCRGLYERYYHNRTTGTCLLFTYGGCGGNENRFETEEGCLKACNGIRLHTCDVCRSRATNPGGECVKKIQPQNNFPSSNNYRTGKNWYRFQKENPNSTPSTQCKEVS